MPNVNDFLSTFQVATTLSPILEEYLKNKPNNRVIIEFKSSKDRFYPFKDVNQVWVSSSGNTRIITTIPYKTIFKKALVVATPYLITFGCGLLVGVASNLLLKGGFLYGRHSKKIGRQDI